MGRPVGHPGDSGILREGLFFREMGNLGNYFWGGGEQAHSVSGLGSPAKKLNISFKKSPLKGLH